MSPPRGPHIHGAYTPPPAEQPLQWSARDSGDGRESRDSAGESRETPPPRPPLRRVTATHSHGAYDSGDGASTVGDGDSSPRSPLTPNNRPTALSAISELDPIHSEFSPSEEPASPHSPSPISVTNLLDDSAPRAPRKLDHYYVATPRSKSCCVIA